MSDVPKFVLYGEGDPATEEAIQPGLALRNWSNLSKEEKEIALQQLYKQGWIDKYSKECLATIRYLNSKYLRQCPGKRLHQTPRPAQNTFSEDFQAMEAAKADFEDLFVNDQPDALVLRMLSAFASCHINSNSLDRARQSDAEVDRKRYIADAFEKFDPLANCLNHIFQQFAVNQVVTRNGFVPRQDEKITDGIYIPTLKALADPKWATVSVALASMFLDYREQRYSEVITKAHSAVQRFLQIAVGEEGKSGKGELGKLFRDAKDRGVIPSGRFVDPVIAAITSFIPSERATNSTAKPALQEATPSDALLMMNVVVVLLQHCLQSME
jgi:hypothetical protein